MVCEDVIPKKWANAIGDAARNWRHSLKRIGEVLNSAVKDGVPLPACYDLLRTFGMSRAAANVAMRWANGEFGDEEYSETLVSKVPHAILQDMTDETVQLLRKPHVILSEGRATQKSILQMDRREVRNNVDVNGFIPLTRSAKPLPDVRTVAAESVDVESGGSVIITSRKDGMLRMRVSGRALSKLRELLSGDKEKN